MTIREAIETLQIIYGIEMKRCNNGNYEFERRCDNAHVKFVLWDPVDGTQTVKYCMGANIGNEGFSDVGRFENKCDLMRETNFALMWGIDKVGDILERRRKKENDE